jgi:hypothetical protein
VKIDVVNNVQLECGHWVMIIKSITWTFVTKYNLTYVSTKNTTLPYNPLVDCTPDVGGNFSNKEETIL